MVGKLIVPDDSKRSYDMFILDNGLEVITISDPSTTTSSAAMEVYVGSLSDPKDLPGLAHFIEHMLFLGTEKFPEESAYQNFVAEHGGFTNAHTALENTNYHFTITSDHLHQSLEMFASFFTCPLFTASGTEREMKAIESEHSKNIQSDVFRFFQFMKDVSNPDHPFSNFATGNLATLKEQPAQKGIDTRLRMIEHYKQHYSANLMKLAVYGKEPNAVLRQWAAELFSSIPNHGFAAPTFPGKPYTEKELGHWYTVVPVRTKRTLGLHFPLDLGHEEYLTKETRYFGHLVGHESEGSILYALKARGWAESLTAGGSMECHNWCLFTVSVEMTKEGLNHMEEIIDLVFQYIGMLAKLGVQEAVYREIKNIAEMEFRYLEPSQPDEFCCQVAHGMLFHSAEHGIAGDYLFFEYSPSSITNLLAKLHPANMNVYVMAHEFADQCDQTISPWYNIKYGRRPLNPTSVARWATLPPSPELHLPSQNPFIPESMDLKPLPADAPDCPVVIHSSSQPSMKVWFKQDGYYLKPKVNMAWALLSHSGYATARLRVLNRLFAMAVTERLNALSYHASVAHLEYYLTPSIEGLQIMVTGFNDKVGVLLREVFKNIKSVDVDEALFTLVRDRLKKTLQNFLKEQAFHIAMDGSATCTVLPRWSYLDTLPIVDTVTLPELREFAQAAVKQFHLEGYIQGNMLREEALAIVAEIKADFMVDVLPMDSNQLPQTRTAKVPKGREWLRPLRYTSADGTNAALHMVQQVGPPTPRTAALCDVFATVTQSHFFTQLRTLETLGYIVQLFPTHEDSGVVGPYTISCIVQSSTHDPLYLYSRAYAFFDALEEYFEDYKEADLKGVAAALIAKRQEKPKTLVEDAMEHWKEIQRQEFLWGRKEREIAELGLLTKADLVAFFQKHISNRSAARRRLTTLVYAPQHFTQYDAVVGAGEAGQGLVVKALPTQLPAYQSSAGAPEETPPQVAAVLDALPAELAAVLRRLPAAALQEMAASLAPEAVAQLAGASVADVEGMVQDMLADQEAGAADPAAAAVEGADAAAKSPLRGIERFNAAPPLVDLHVVLDAGRWKQTLPMYPFRLAAS